MSCKWITGEEETLFLLKDLLVTILKLPSLLIRIFKKESSTDFDFELEMSTGGLNSLTFSIFKLQLDLKDLLDQFSSQQTQAK